MHRPRLLGWNDENCYHVISRTTGADFLLGPDEKEMFSRMLRKVAGFCGVEVLTWCCLSNHFHLLIRISESRNQQLRDDLMDDPQRFSRHLALLYSKKARKEILSEITDRRSAGQQLAATEMVERFLLRIGDLATFVKELKQRFSIWYNHKHNRTGTLWSARFRSVLVENTSTALRTVACYIDLNPLRAGVADDPKDYRWCGYAQAVAGISLAKNGLASILEPVDNTENAATTTPANLKSVLANYRLLLFGKAVELTIASSGTLRQGASPEAVEKAINEGGSLPIHERSLHRIRHLTEGAALGSRAFLKDLIDQRPEQVSSSRKTAHRPVRSLSLEDFHSLRDVS